MIVDLKENNFHSSVLDNSAKPVVVNVWASWCHNCKRLAPIFAASAEENKDKVDFYQLKADDNLDLVKSLKIMGVPTLLFYRHGILIAKKPGVRSQKSIAKTLEPLYNYSLDEAIEHEYKGLFKKIFGK